MRTINIALAALLLLPAGAKAGETGNAVHVTYADLNLRNEAGVRVLDRRLAHAVRKVCGVEDGSTQMTRQLEARRCVSAIAAQIHQQRNQALAAARAAPAALASLAR